VREAVERLQQLLVVEGLDLARPEPAIGWTAFKQFATEPVESAGGPAGEALWFEASDGDPADGRRGHFTLARLFSQTAPDGGVCYDQVVAEFSCEPGVRLGLGGIVPADDPSDLPAFFRAVEASESFRGRLAYRGWSFQVQLDTSEDAAEP